MATSTLKKRKPSKPKSRFLKDGSLKESFIQSDIMRWLETTDLLFWRQNSGTTFMKGRKVSLGPSGAPDLVVIVPELGLFCGLEVKSAKGTQRKEQKLFERRLVKAGGRYFLVRSVEDAKNAIAECLGANLCTQRSLQTTGR